jgi:putative ABC transport system permease protein
VRDFPIGSIRQAINPTIFFVDPTNLLALNVRIDRSAVPETLQGIDRLWKTLGDQRPIRREFLDQSIENLYRDIRRQTTLFGSFAAIALFIACLGLFGLSASTAERRTKEIGIRKAMGAATADIARLLLWQYAKPVLWANLIAWPVAALLMRRWLQGFAYRIDLEPWLFLVSTALALGIALLTVSAHSILVARAKPVEALRYE